EEIENRAGGQGRVRILAGRGVGSPGERRAGDGRKQHGEDPQPVLHSRLPPKRVSGPVANARQAESGRYRLFAVPGRAKTPRRASPYRSCSSLPMIATSTKSPGFSPASKPFWTCT